MTKLFKAFICVYLIVFNTSFPQTQGEVVLKDDELKFLPILKLSDIYSVLPQLDLYTLDGYRHSSLQNNIFKNNPSDIIILINGVRTEFGFLNKVNLSQLPLEPNLIDSIVIKYNPVNYFGEYSNGILIDFITKEPSEDISFKIEYSTGNEAGDPGPYRYTEYFSDNVDQFGPNFSFTTSYGSKKFGLTLNFIDQVSPATDPAILKRTPDFLFENYQVRYSGLSLNSSIKTDLSNHNIFSAFTKSGQPLLGYIYGADLYFDDNLSKEIPYEDKSFYLTSGNEIFLNNDYKFILDVNLKSSKAKQSRVSGGLNFKLNDMLINTKAGFASSIGQLNYFAGISYEYQKLNNEYNDLNYLNNIYSFFATTDFNSSKEIKHIIDFNYKTKTKSSGYFVNMTNLFEINDQNRFKFSASIGNLSSMYNSSEISEIINPFYSEYDSLINQFENGNAFSYSFNLDYIHNFNNNTSINTGFIYFIDNEMNYILNDFIFNEQLKTVQNKSYELLTDLEGSRGEFYFRLDHNFSKNFKSRFYYRYKSYLSGDEDYKLILKRIPVHKIFYSIYYNLFEDLYGSLIFTYLSSSEWVEYRDIKSEGNDLYKSKLSDNFSIDCSVTKSLWKERIKITASVKNLLNNRIQYHPIGGSFDLTFFLKVQADLQSIIRL